MLMLYYNKNNKILNVITFKNTLYYYFMYSVLVLYLVYNLFKNNLCYYFILAKYGIQTDIEEFKNNLCYYFIYIEENKKVRLEQFKNNLCYYFISIIPLLQKLNISSNPYFTIFFKIFSQAFYIFFIFLVFIN